MNYIMSSSCTIMVALFLGVVRLCDFSYWINCFDDQLISRLPKIYSMIFSSAAVQLGSLLDWGKHLLFFAFVLAKVTPCTFWFLHANNFMSIVSVFVELGGAPIFICQIPCLCVSAVPSSSIWSKKGALPSYVLVVFQLVWWGWGSWCFYHLKIHMIFS